MPQGTLQDPIWTWNTFATPAVVIAAVLALWQAIKKLFDERDAKTLRIAELLEERERNKEMATKEWRTAYDKKIDCVKETVDEIKDDMHKKVPWDHCEARRKELGSELKNFDDRLRAMGS